MNGNTPAPVMMNVQQAARILEAEWSGGNPFFNTVSTDSRTLRAGSLFVALSGERFDGHRFIPDAIDKGAVAAMVADEAIEPLKNLVMSDFALLRVKDPRLALGQLAAVWRKRFDPPLVAVTGSNGKTTVKEMLAAILRQHAGCDRVLATSGNFNNDIGVPLTLLQINPSHHYAVIEMGMNHSGEIAYLSGLASPTVAVITNAGSAHIAHFGKTDAIAAAKGEIFEGLSESGIAVINADDRFAPLWRQLAGKRRIVDFGLINAASVSARRLQDTMENGWLLTLPEDQIELMLQVPGQHNVYNALAAAAAAYAAGIGLPAIAAGLGSYTGTHGRLQITAGLHHSVLIDDTYNANPESMQAALAVLCDTNGKKMLVMGDMGELGVAAAEYHRQIGQLARAAKVDTLLALGELSVHAVEAFGHGGQHFVNVDELMAYLTDLLDTDVTVLVKGSRSMRMERVIEKLTVAEKMTDRNRSA
ncbi:UDP-N-acetylmuramoyl-tripeptide--D-alanyl-D-alanine ligase [Nitrosomonas mobilis]|uniref:UDP-N-acetylmuramoyl-tripeptide--D-alanyl-D-alanine ligase n=1 Tax=Nitrosomonas mobilis TaxID=51642 RepID=A0A1G5SHG5_9PROT|nr:UDP-N-acetylmuramoyl-tripeptide--D-alanyl-D-alanine ligase [Nitrosomonas mobilis]SCZ86624.1 UDP-N-acetylmuramoyl-tripeptide:D-alanyl-D-alanine ligase [Nitrosomonas mobilis]